MNGPNIFQMLLVINLVVVVLPAKIDSCLDAWCPISHTIEELHYQLITIYNQLLQETLFYVSSPFISTGPGTDSARPGDIKITESVWSGFLCIIQTLVTPMLAL